VIADIESKREVFLHGFNDKTKRERLIIKEWRGTSER